MLRLPASATRLLRPLTLLSLLLVACQLLTPSAPAPESADPSTGEPAAPQPTTAVAAETATLAGEPSPATAAAAAPTPTALGPGPAINPQNAARLQPVGLLGDGDIQSMDWSPDGGALAVATSIGVYLYDVAEGAQSLRKSAFLPSDVWVTHVTFSPDGRYLAFGDTGVPCRHERPISLLDLSSREVVRTFGQAVCNARTIRFNGDGTLLAYGREGLIWDVESGDLVADLPASGALAFHPGGERVALSPAEDQVHVVDLYSGDVLRQLSGAEGEIYSVAFSPDGLLLAATASNDQTVVWDLESGNLLHTFTLHNGLYPAPQLAFTGDGKRLYAGWRRGALYDLETQSVVADPPGAVSALSPDEEFVAYDCGMLCIVPFINTHNQIWTTQAWHVPGGRLVPLNHDQLLAGSFLWRVNGQQGPERALPDVSAIAVSNNGRFLLGYAGNDRSRLRLWDRESGTMVRELPIDPGRGLKAISPDGGRLVTTDTEDDSVLLWDGATGALVFEAPPQYTKLTEVRFDRQGMRYAVGNWDNRVTVYDAVTGHREARLSHPVPADVRQDWPEIQSLAFSPDGQRLASGIENPVVNNVVIWDLETEEPLHVLEGHEAGVRALAFSPDGALLASGDAYGVIRIWDSAGGRQVHVLEVQHKGIRSLAFGPEERRLYAIGADDTIRIYQVSE